MSSAPPFPAAVLRLLAAIAFVLGFTRAWTRPVLGDGAFQLVRVGEAWLSGSPLALTVPPGGHDAPILGAVVTAAGSLFAASQETLTRPIAAVLFGLATALLVRVLARTTDRASTGLGAALLLFPPAIATSFGLRPDAALGGVLLLAAFGGVLERGRHPLALAAAWAAALATPAALPAAIGLQFLPDGRSRSRRPDPRIWIGMVGAITVVALASLSLPEGARGEVGRGLLGGWARPLDGWPSAGPALRDVWILGLLLFGPLLAPAIVREAKPSPAVHLSWSAAAVATLLFAGEGGFRAQSAALLPTACLLTVLMISRIPDPGVAPGAPRRAVLLAFVIPIAFLIAGENPDRRARRLETARTAQLAQIAAKLSSPGAPRGEILARETGALATHSGRAVRPLGVGDPFADRGWGRPGVALLRDGRRPVGRAEERLFLDPRFLAGWAPRPIHRGREGSTLDLIWVRRELPSPPVDPGYARALAEGFRAEAAGRPDVAASHFREAVDREPATLGLAREALGLVLAKSGDPEGARARFDEARRDPAAARARVRLADAAINRGDLLRADSLLAEAGRWSGATPSLSAVRARLFGLAGDVEKAAAESDAATRLDSDDPRTLVNHGTLLWRGGAPDAARAVWDLAVSIEPTALRFLGDYRAAPDDAPAPPLLPLFGPLAAPGSAAAPTPDARGGPEPQSSE